MFRIFRLVKWSKHVVKTPQNRKLLSWFHEENTVVKKQTIDFCGKKRIIISTGAHMCISAQDA